MVTIAMDEESKKTLNNIHFILNSLKQAKEGDETRMELLGTLKTAVESSSNRIPEIGSSEYLPHLSSLLECLSSSKLYV